MENCDSCVRVAEMMADEILIVDIMVRAAWSCYNALLYDRTGSQVVERYTNTFSLTLLDFSHF